MSGVDPRAQLAVLVAVVLAALLGGVPGVVGGAALALAVIARSDRARRLGRSAIAVLPIAAVVVLADAIGGQADRGALTGARLVVLALVGAAFAASADSEELVAALRWLRIPYDVTFALVAGARLVPLAAADVADLGDAARLRGVRIDGAPVDRLRSWSRLLVPLLVVTIRRGLRLGEAMEARGFVAGGARTARTTLRWTTRDAAIVALAAAYLVAALIVAR